MNASNTTHKLKERARFSSQCVLFTLLLALLVIAGTAMLVLASDVSDAEYRGKIEVSNNSTSASNVFTVFDLNTQSMVDTGKLNSGANDTAIKTASGTDVAFMPSANASYPWATYVPSIGEDETLYQYLYTGGVTGGKIRYFPGDSGMTTADSASLELSDNFTIEQKGWVDTTYSVNQTLAYKENASRTYISATGNITSQISEEDIIFLTGDDESLSASTTNWRGQVFTTPAFDGTIQFISIYGYKASAATQLTLSIRATAGTPPEPTGADLVSANKTVSNTTADWISINLPAYELNASTQYAIVVRADDDFIYWRADGSSPPYGDGNWAYSVDSGSSWTANTDKDFLFNISYAKVSVTATGISSGEHTIKTTADGSNLKIYVDDVEKDSTALSGASVPDNSANWTFLQNDVMPYMEYHKIWVDGVLQQHIEWEYTTGNFTDLSGNSHDATPTFRTTSSDADVSAELVSFLGLMTATPPSAAGQEGWNIMPTVPDAPEGFFTELNMSFWGAGYIQEFCDATDIPLPLVVFPYAFGLAIGLGGLAWWVSSGGGRNKHGRGSLLAMAITTLIVMIYFVYGGGGVIPAWVLLPFGIEVLVLIVWRQTPSPF